MGNGNPSGCLADQLRLFCCSAMGPPPPPSPKNCHSWVRCSPNPWQKGKAQAKSHSRKDFISEDSLVFGKYLSVLFSLSVRRARTFLEPSGMSVLQAGSVMVI